MSRAFNIAFSSIPTARANNSRLNYQLAVVKSHASNLGHFTAALAPQRIPDHAHWRPILTIIKLTKITS